MYRELFRQHFGENFSYLTDSIEYEKSLDLIDKTCESKIYNRKYELITNRVTPKGYSIHHIDSNRSNNHISNLVLLPNKLHSRYHKYKELILPFKGKTIPDGLLCDTKLYNNNGSNVMPDLDILDKYTNFFNIQQICCNWVYLRDCILGISVNVFETTDYEILYKKYRGFNI